MFCPKCGKELPAGARFCGGCGQQLGVQAAPSQAAPANGKSYSTQSMPAQPVQQTRPAQPVQQTRPAQAATAQSMPATAKVASGISGLQSKLDNSNASFIRGRSIWDIVGFTAVVLIVISFFLPEIQGIELPQGMMNFSLSTLMAFMGSYSQSAQFSGVLLIFLLPAALAAVDLLVVKENSSRHIRLIIWGVVSIASQMPAPALIDFAKTNNVSDAAALSLGTGYYLWIFASLVLIAVGIIGIVQRYIIKSAA
ncbi:MAG: zinc ribbon domain-containing protein [Phoenicibacter congonensis]|uniref:Zinc ribbon domain-containing protein n=1 Tax=Phoenicibacter congonensis TaxID=1944646 RepID=A0AA43RLP0_9ACTN|nr:zinc ribbon domain-containing protein [Phoenicibacter congonensis]